MNSRLVHPSEHSYTLTMQPLQDGTRLKDCKVSIDAFVYTNKLVSIDASYIRKVDDDSVEITLVMEDAQKIGKGNMKLMVHIGIPDANFPDGYRNQTYEVCVE